MVIARQPAAKPSHHALLSFTAHAKVAESSVSVDVIV